MTQTQLARLQQLIDEGQEERFYSWKAWRRLSETVRTRIDRCECQACKRQGKYSAAEIVHHIKQLRERPDLALSIYDPETGERQLEALCRPCHEREHPERMRRTEGAAAKPLTEER